ncbi:hypothetical protein STCU_11079 [Strigomonas culicis]|uniref:Uncharacterized protein n=1 Tax=Strigomonas culicis TaxID=28005 RepID=S9TF29_9TRYP|nr:hypothetical protein STCU_11079 [Strigomonas culicis]|eukprot:EPY16642.1 hypothetical protein STCU_11079 [Strigomonas culicis]
MAVEFSKGASGGSYDDNANWARRPSPLKDVQPEPRRQPPPQNIKTNAPHGDDSRPRKPASGNSQQNSASHSNNNGGRSSSSRPSSVPQRDPSAEQQPRARRNTTHEHRPQPAAPPSSSTASQLGNRHDGPRSSGGILSPSPPQGRDATQHHTRGAPHGSSSSSRGAPNAHVLPSVRGTGAGSGAPRRPPSPDEDDADTLSSPVESSTFAERRSGSILSRILLKPKSKSHTEKNSRDSSEDKSGNDSRTSMKKHASILQRFHSKSKSHKEKSSVDSREEKSGASPHH